MAEIYREQGYKISAGSAHKNEIREKLIEVTGLSQQSIDKYLVSEFKSGAIIPDKKPTIPASERIEHELGEEYVVRHRKEVIEEG